MRISEIVGPLRLYIAKKTSETKSNKEKILKPNHESSENKNHSWKLRENKKKRINISSVWKG